MASNKFVALAIVAIFLPTVTMAKEHIVGDSGGWTTTVNYTQWAMGKVFYVGDTLVFQYPQGHHNVFKVDGPAFQNCTKPAPNLALTTGNDTIPLSTIGKKWYICGFSTHCESGQKLVINVVPGAWPPTAPAPSTANGIISSGYQVIMAAMVAVVMIMM